MDLLVAHCVTGNTPEPDCVFESRPVCCAEGRSATCASRSFGAVARARDQKPRSESCLMVRSILRSMTKWAGSQKKKFARRFHKDG